MNHPASPSPAPPQHPSSTPDDLIVQAFAKMDKTALGVALGILLGLTVFAATVFLLLKGGEHPGTNLVLLNQFFFGYSITYPGSLIGLLNGLVFGFVLGGLIAFLHNLFFAMYLYFIKFKADISSDFME